MRHGSSEIQNNTDKKEPKFHRQNPPCSGIGNAERNNNKKKQGICLNRDSQHREEETS